MPGLLFGEGWVRPLDALCSFDNFNRAQSSIKGHVAKCQEFAANPAGVLFLVGSPGNGKTHLAVAVLGELSRRFRKFVSSIIQIFSPASPDLPVSGAWRPGSARRFERLSESSNTGAR